MAVATKARKTRELTRVRATKSHLAISGNPLTRNFRLIGLDEERKQQEEEEEEKQEARRRRGEQWRSRTRS